jgi:hypothetical protein
LSVEEQTAVDKDTWYENNEAELRESFVEYLLASKHRDIEDFVFLFEAAQWKGDNIVKKARGLQLIWDNYIENKYQEAISDGPEHDD